MDFVSKIFMLLITVVTIVSTSEVLPEPNTNAGRLARGLPILPPNRRSPTETLAAREGKPSGHPPICKVGSLQCCEVVTTAHDPRAGVLLKLLGIKIDPNTCVGLSCFSLSTSGYYQGTCAGTSKPVCCKDCNYEGAIDLDCSEV